MPVTIPATGTGTATPIISTDNVTADSSQVQNVQITTVAAGVLTRVPTGTQYVEDAALGTPTGTAVLLHASTAVPTAMNADGDAVTAWANRNGAQVVINAPHLGMNADPWTLTFKGAQYTTTQTGVALWTPTSGKKVVITSYQIQVGGTTAGTMQLWFGASADTTFTRGTDGTIFDGEFAPSATLKPGVVQTGLWIASTADYILRVTDSAAINPLTVTVWGYEI